MRAYLFQVKDIRTSGILELDTVRSSVKWSIAPFESIDGPFRTRKELSSLFDGYLYVPEMATLFGKSGRETSLSSREENMPLRREVPVSEVYHLLEKATIVDAYVSIAHIPVLWDGSLISSHQVDGRDLYVPTGKSVAYCFGKPASEGRQSTPDYIRRRQDVAINPETALEDIGPNPVLSRAESFERNLDLGLRSRGGIPFIR